jgi:hypothetical protein
MLKRLLALAAGLSFTLAIYAATVEWADNAPDHYVVRKGDTLWDISARFLKKPWLWPEVWQPNPQVHNPHLIYPGEVLVMGNGHVTQGSIEPHVRATPLDNAIAPIPLDQLEQFLKHTRILSENAFENAPHVVAIEENQLLGTTGQLVYVRGSRAVPGQRFALLRPLGRYYDMPPVGDGAPREAYRQTPDARDGRPAMLWHHGPNEFTLHGNLRFLGYEMLEYGTVEVTRAGEPASALVLDSDFEVRPGDYVLPIETAPYDDSYLPHPPARMPPNMRVLAFTDAMNAVGPRQVVALSRGDEDGVENGQVYAIYQPGETVDDRTDYPEGSAHAFFNPHDSKVALPPEYIGHVMIFRTFDRISYGLVMDAIKPVHRGDFLHDPDTTP